MNDNEQKPATDVAPLPLFSELGLHADILRAVTEGGYTTPTPIQAKAIPVALSGKDLMGAAQTGTGKTAGFSLPILQLLLPHANTSASPARHPVRALVLTPTRELADQVAENVSRYGKHTSLRSAVVFGGVDIHPQTAELRRGVEVLIATPGRLLDHVQQKSVNLTQVQILVLDEADRMLDMGFLPDLQRIINLLPAKRQNMMFSATFSPEIQKLARSFMQQPELIEVARRNATSENIQQVLYTLGSIDDKRAATSHLIRSQNMRQVIVFSNTKIGAGRLARQLEKDGIAASAIHGDKTQGDRMKALEAFKAGSIVALVATDVAARGLDIADLPCVINFDLPHSPEDYVHRIGRTGRAGASGIAYSLAVPGDERYLADIEKLTKKKIERAVLADFESGRTEHAGGEGRGRRERSDSDERPSGARREARSEGKTESRPEGRTEGRPAARSEGAGEGREQRPRNRRPEPTELRFDAEFERLRARVSAGHVRDELFSKPYVEKPVGADAAISADASKPRGQTMSASIVRQKAPVAALLGGGKRKD
jgi:superfamily II DNA/RNA helicase